MARVVAWPHGSRARPLPRPSPADAFEAWLAKYPGHEVVSYINCSAAVKALSTIICTSSNAVRVVRSLPKDVPIVAVCRSGGRSAQACVILEGAGFARVANLSGGMIGWRSLGFAVDAV